MSDLSAIAKQVARTLDCKQSGSCFPFAAEFAKRVDGGCTIHEGLVKFRGSIPLPHNWITTDRGETIDPTLAQFDFFNLSTVSYIPLESYTPLEYRREAKRKKTLKSN